MELQPVVKSQDSGELPLDQFGIDRVLVEYGRELLVDECLGGRGIEYAPPAVDASKPGPKTSSRYGRRLFNESLAERFGYHFAPTERFSRREMQEFYSPVGATIESRALDECQAEARDVIPEREVLAESLAVSVEVRDDCAVVDALDRWRRCLLTVVDASDVADHPDAMPVQSRQVSFDLGRAVEWNAAPASDEEKALAMLDAGCRESSGYSAAVYEAEWAAHERLVEEWNSQLLEDRAEHANAEASAREVIERTGTDG